MSAMQVATAIACVALISLGQIFFKTLGLMLAASDNEWSAKVVFVAVISLSLYGIATVIWVWLLKSTPLTKAYPYMALSFALVPAASVFLFGERVSVQALIGLSLIVLGLVISAR